MRKLSIGLLAAALFCLFCTVAHAQGKIGVVDFQQILKESSAGKAAQAQIKQKRDKMQADIQAKGSEIEKLQEKLEREAMVMSRDKREAQAREIRIKINDIRSLQKKYREDFRQFEGRLIQRIQKEVFEIVERLGKQGNYTMILEKVGVLYYQDAIDITDQVIARYNKAFSE